MLKKTISVLFLFSICAASVLWLSGAAYAIHKGAGGLVCGNCHTMHNSQGSTSTGDGNGGLGGNAGGSLILLRGAVSTRAEVHKLCLQCHATNGAQAAVSHTPQMVQAPKVYSSAAWNDTMAFNAIGAGGNFSTELNTSWVATTTPALGYGHSLGETTVVPPGGDLAISTFSCTNCHDPHGTSNALDSNINIFRNLRVNATGASANSGVKFLPTSAIPAPPAYATHKSYVGGVNGTYFGGSETDGVGVIWPVFKGALTGNPVTDGPNSNAYATGSDDTLQNTRTMSKWCAQCHDYWHEKIVGPSTQGALWTTDINYSQGMGPDWRRHPVNGMMPRAAAAGCASNCHISILDRVNYDTTLIIAGKGLPVTTSDRYTDYVYYLPKCGEAGNPPCSGMDTPTENYNHKVFCLSCHFAHAGPYRDSLRWDYLASVSQGSQNGNSIASTKGCQLCHNR